jgi:single-strand DNA-binding protein
VYVEGTPDVRTYTTADGRNGASLTLRIASVQLLGSKSSGGDSPAPDQSAGATYTPNAASSSDDSMADDLPF